MLSSSLASLRPQRPSPTTRRCTRCSLRSISVERYLLRSICHGTLVQLKARLASGRLLAEGERWTGYTNAEEDLVDQAMGLRFQPYRIEDEAKAISGTTLVQGQAYRPFAVTYDRLITGQQGSSGLLTAEYDIRALEP